MRSFQRTGPTVVLQETRDRARLVRGPSEDSPGDVVVYDEELGDDPIWAESLASDPYWTEIVERESAEPSKRGRWTAAAAEVTQAEPVETEEHI